MVWSMTVLSETRSGFRECGGYDLHQDQERIGSADHLSRMPKYRIHVINSDFNACEEVEMASFESAKNHGLMGALRIGTDELCKEGGVSFFGAEVRVESEGNVQSRMVIAMGASPLQ